MNYPHHYSASRLTLLLIATIILSQCMKRTTVSAAAAANNNKMYKTRFGRQSSLLDYDGRLFEAYENNFEVSEPLMSSESTSVWDTNDYEIEDNEWLSEDSFDEKMQPTAEQQSVEDDLDGGTFSTETVIYTQSWDEMHENLVEDEDDIVQVPRQGSSEGNMHGRTADYGEDNDASSVETELYLETLEEDEEQTESYVSSGETVSQVKEISSETREVVHDDENKFVTFEDYLYENHDEEVSSSTEDYKQPTKTSVRFTDIHTDLIEPVESSASTIFTTYGTETSSIAPFDDEIEQSTDTETVSGSDSTEWEYLENVTYSHEHRSSQQDENVWTDEDGEWTTNGMKNTSRVSDKEWSSTMFGMETSEEEEPEKNEDEATSYYDQQTDIEEKMPPEELLSTSSEEQQQTSEFSNDNDKTTLAQEQPTKWETQTNSIETERIESSTVVLTAQKEADEESVSVTEQDKTFATDIESEERIESNTKGCVRAGHTFSYTYADGRASCYKFNYCTDPDGPMHVVNCPYRMMWFKNGRTCVPEDEKCRIERLRRERKPVWLLYRLECPPTASLTPEERSAVHMFNYYQKLNSSLQLQQNQPVDLLTDVIIESGIFRHVYDSCAGFFKCLYERDGAIHLLKEAKLNFCPGNTFFNQEWNWCVNNAGFAAGYGSTHPDPWKRNKCQAQLY